jgi:predicted ABC-type ATPase
MIAGPNGSGKSFLKASLESDGVAFGEYFNADDIARGLEGDAVAVGRRAQELVRAGRDVALAARRDYTWETVMSHPSHVEHLRAAKAAGYLVRVFYVATDDPRVNVGRVANRVARGGHDVPTDRITTRYEKSLAGLADAVEVADVARVWDNSDAKRPFRVVADRDPGGVVLKGEGTPEWAQRHLVEALRDRVPVETEAERRHRDERERDADRAREILERAADRGHDRDIER